MNIIAAMDENGSIGKNNFTSWHLKPDLIRFKKMTQDKNLEKYFRLPQRNVITLSKNSPLPIFQNN